MQKELSLIIPAHYEQNRIIPTLEQYSIWLEKNLPKSHELIVVCQAVDPTQEIAKKYRAKIILLKNDLGKGYAIKRGISNSNSNYIAFVDADNSIPPNEFEKLWQNRKKSDIIVASRYSKENSPKMPLARGLMSKSFLFLANVLFSPNLRDIQCGAKLMKKDAIQNILKKIQTNGYCFDLELIARAKKDGKQILEIPIIWTYKKGSKLPILAPVTMALELISIRTKI